MKQTIVLVMEDWQRGSDQGFPTSFPEFLVLRKVQRNVLCHQLTCFKKSNPPMYSFQ